MYLPGKWGGGECAKWFAVIDVLMLNFKVVSCLKNLQICFFLNSVFWIPWKPYHLPKKNRIPNEVPYHVSSLRKHAKLIPDCLINKNDDFKKLCILDTREHRLAFRDPTFRSPWHYIPYTHAKIETGMKTLIIHPKLTHLDVGLHCISNQAENEKISVKK